MKKSTWIVFLWAAAGPWLMAQKVEVEKRIPERRFPAASLSLLDSQFQGRKCVRYYLDSDGKTTNFEAKFKWQGHRYSVEFFNNGELKDAEKQINFKKIPSPAQKEISGRFQKDFKKHKVKRVQEQTRPTSGELRYEIEVKGKNNEGTAYFEYLFEEDGRLVESRKILLPPNNINLY